MSKKKEKNKPVIITIIAVVLMIIIAMATNGERTVSIFENIVGVVITPVQSFATNVSNSIVNAFRELFNTTDADKENAKLKNDLAELEVKVADYEEMKLENERLKALLNYASEEGITDFVTASVIGNSDSIWFDMFTINAGRSSGIEVGDPVVVSGGLVGIVTDVGATWCKVRSIIDADSNISVMVERTRDNGFVRGVLNANTAESSMELYFLPTGSDIVPGDVIITNGLGSSKLPKGLTVGTVTEVRRVTGANTDEANAIVVPSVDFFHIEDVIVITGGEQD